MAELTVIRSGDFVTITVKGYGNEVSGPTACLDAFTEKYEKFYSNYRVINMHQELDPDYSHNQYSRHIILTVFLQYDTPSTLITNNPQDEIM